MQRGGGEGGYRGNYRGRGSGGRGRGRGGGGGGSRNDGGYYDEGYGNDAPEQLFTSGARQRSATEAWGGAAQGGRDDGSVQFRRGPPRDDGYNDNRGGGSYRGKGRGDYSQGGGASSTPRSSTVVIFVNPETGSPAISHEIDAVIELLRRKILPVILTATSPRMNTATGGISFLAGDIDQAMALKALSGMEVRPQQKIVITTSEDKNKLAGMQINRPISLSNGAFSASAPPLNSFNTGGGSRGHPGSGSGSGSGSTKATLQQFLQNRYNNGFLNLENMAQDPILNAARISFPGGPRSDIGFRLIKTAAELFPDATTISFAQNHLHSVEPIESLAQQFPGLVNLSLRGNVIREFRDVERLGGSKLPNLRELILADNPIRDQEVASSGDDLSYRSRITRLFPSIQVLDQLPVPPRISFGQSGDSTGAAPVQSTLPVPIRGNFFDTPSTETTVLEFLTCFFMIYDSNRGALEHMYDSSATFSYQIADIHPNMPKRRDHTSRKSQDWDPYALKNRDLSETRDLIQRTATLHVGNEAIVRQGLLKLPSSAHDLSDASKICVDAWQTGSLLPTVCIYVMVHGEFEEPRAPGAMSSSSRGRGRGGRNDGYGSRNGPSTIRRSFDRTFIIAPAPPGTFAATQGWKCIIVSDQLTVRNHNGSEAWKPDVGLNVPSSITAAVSGSTGSLGSSSSTSLNGANVNPNAASVMQLGQQLQKQFNAQSSAGPDLSQEQQAKIQELQRITGLTYSYALDCLNTTGWDLQLGVALVSEKRTSLPLDAWQTVRSSLLKE
ncbi:nuclear mRNA export, poly(A)+RNA binding protein [Gryganskiella cystojenkinii]|nr:nuclear mRNA export, poly(A)+RNA binding protein [Gryganskiella cystojenkinii]